jgi:hypothetical protein
MIGDARLPVRFWSKVRVNSITGCWEWTAATTDGYGSFGVGRNVQRQAHRHAYETLVGPVPDGLELDHLCRVRSCCNPAHVEPVTRQVNCERSPIIGKWKASVTRCPEGHEYNDANTYYDARRNKRQCRICARAWSRAYRERQAG